MLNCLAHSLHMFFIEWMGYCERMMMMMMMHKESRLKDKKKHHQCAIALLTNPNNSFHNHENKQSQLYIAKWHSLGMKHVFSKTMWYFHATPAFEAADHCYFSVSTTQHNGIPLFCVSDTSESTGTLSTVVWLAASCWALAIKETRLLNILPRISHNCRLFRMKNHTWTVKTCVHMKNLTLMPFSYS